MICKPDTLLELISSNIKHGNMSSASGGFWQWHENDVIAATFHKPAQDCHWLPRICSITLATWWEKAMIGSKLVQTYVLLASVANERWCRYIYGLFCRRSIWGAYGMDSGGTDRQEVRDKAAEYARIMPPHSASVSLHKGQEKVCKTRGKKVQRWCTYKRPSEGVTWGKRPVLSIAVDLDSAWMVRIGTVDEAGKVKEAVMLVRYCLSSCIWRGLAVLSHIT